MKASLFEVRGGSKECHISESFKTFDIDAINSFLFQAEIKAGIGTKPMFGRFFVRDYKGMAPILIKSLPCPYSQFSIIEQPSLDGSEISIWLYYSDAHNHQNGYQHFWNVYRPSDAGDRTTEILSKYSNFLSEKGCSLADNCIRTWFFVDDIDNNYALFVNKRKSFFTKASLTEQTHYIASTGIYGGGASIVSMDSYAIKGLDEHQVAFLKGSSHLSSTISYGVTFERGTSVTYGDRKHVFISGTASIDEEGNVLFEGDALSQTKRLFENIDVLLREAGTSLSDIKMLIVYLRNPSDYESVSQYVERHFPEVPTIMVHAPVCRPQWLVEAECIAVAPVHDSHFRKY